jgi:hypothetical protein
VFQNEARQIRFLASSAVWLLGLFCGMWFESVSQKEIEFVSCKKASELAVFGFGACFGEPGVLNNLSISSA